MANHCIDVVCSGCGKCWDLRGLGGNESFIDKNQISQLRKYLSTLNDITSIHDYGNCCDGFYVVNDSYLYGLKNV